jgi:hypothetical protein
MREYRELQVRLRAAHYPRDSWQWCVGNWGCYFLSICQIVGIVPTLENLKFAYDAALACGAMQTNDAWHCWVKDAQLLINAIDPQRRKWRYKRSDQPYATDNPAGYQYDSVCYETADRNGQTGTHYSLWEGEDTEAAQKRRILGHRYFGLKREQNE